MEEQQEWYCWGCAQFVSADQCPDCGILREEQEGEDAERAKQEQ